MKSSHRWAERGLLLLGLLAVLLTFRDYGATWDERAQSRYGELVLAYFRSGLSDRRCNSFEDLYYYGPLFEALAAAVYELVGAWKEEIRHLLSALTGLAAVWGTIRYARLVSRDSLLPFLAGLALLVWPRFYGHAFVNSKDVPFACAFVWAMVAIARWSEVGGFRRALLAGLAIGLALDLRPGALMIFGFMALAALPRLQNPAQRRGVVAQLAAAALTAWMVLVAPWPWAHEDPLRHPIEALRLSVAFPSNHPMLFEGRWVRPAELPWDYAPKWLLITTPESFLALAAIGIVVLATRARRSAPLPLLTLAWVIGPIAFVMLARPQLYDEVRHLLFVLPGAAVLVGSGLEWIVARARPRVGRLAWALPLLLFDPVPDLVRLHPYQMTYFNRTTRRGGALSQRYDTDYWVSSYKEAMEWVNRQPVPAGRVRHVLVAGFAGAYYAASYYAAPHVVVRMIAPDPLEKTLPAGFDSYIGTSRWFMNGLFPEVPVVHVIARDSMAYTVVKSRIDRPALR